MNCSNTNLRIKSKKRFLALQNISTMEKILAYSLLIEILKTNEKLIVVNCALEYYLLAVIKLMNIIASDTKITMCYSKKMILTTFLKYVCELIKETKEQTKQKWHILF